MKNYALITLRLKRGLTKKELSKRTGLSIPTISDMENGTRLGTVESWKAIKEALDIPSEDMWDLINYHE